MAGLTQAQALALVQQGLAWRSDLSTQITSMFDLVQYDELERGTSLPWFLLLEDQPLTGSANSGSLTIPTNREFIREVDDGALRIVSSDGPVRFLVKRSYDWIIEDQQSDEGVVETGDPEFYAIRSSTFYCSPIPTAAWTAYATYYAHDAVFSGLASGAQNLWLKYAPGLLVNLTGVRMAEDLEHNEAMSKFQRRYDAARARMEAEIALREGSNREFVMGNQA